METHIGRRFFHIDVRTDDGNLPPLLVMNYCLEPTNKHTSWSFPYDLQCGCTLDCYVFVHEQAHFSLERILFFKTREVPNECEQLSHFWHGTHKYYNVDDSHGLLNIHF